MEGKKWLLRDHDLNWPLQVNKLIFYKKVFDMSFQCIWRVIFENLGVPPGFLRHSQLNVFKTSGQTLFEHQLDIVMLAGIATTFSVLAMWPCKKRSRSTKVVNIQEANGICHGWIYHCKYDITNFRHLWDMAGSGHWALTRWSVNDKVKVFVNELIPNSSIDQR